MVGDDDVKVEVEVEVEVQVEEFVLKKRRWCVQ